MKKKVSKNIVLFALVFCAGLVRADVVASFGVNFTTADAENISTDTGVGFAKEGYPAPVSWMNIPGSADNAWGQTIDSVAYRVMWTAVGTWNSGADTSTDTGKITYGYLDDAANLSRTKATVTITGLPADKKYAVALLLSGDGNNSGNFNNRYTSVWINGETYSYVDGILKSGEDAKAARSWGNRAKNASGALVEGTNVMFVEELSGSVLSISSAVDDCQVGRLTIAGVQIWVTDTPVSFTPPADGAVFSLNFHSEESSSAGAVASDAVTGLVAVKGWNNLTGNSGEATSLTMWNGSDALSVSNLDFSYSANTKWGWANATDVFLKGYLDDGGSGISISMDNIPFTEYSVIVYAATDTGNASFKPVQINGNWYAGRSDLEACGYASLIVEEEKDGFVWGQSQNLTSEYGVNALRVDGLSGQLTISGRTKSGSNRGCIAAIQIVNTGDLMAFPSTSIEGDVNASEIEWTVEPAADGRVVIPAMSPATIDLDESIAAATLLTVGEAIAFVGESSLTSAETILNADTDFSRANVSLGAVTLAAGKTLAVSQTNVYSSIVRNENSKLKITGDIDYPPLADNTTTETTCDMTLGVVNGTLNGRRWEISGGVVTATDFYLASGGDWLNPGSQSALILRNGARLNVTGDSSDIGNRKTDGAMMFAECGNGALVSVTGAGTELAVPNGALNISRDGLVDATVADGALLHAYKLGGVRNTSTLTVTNATLKIGKEDAVDGLVKMTTCKLNLQDATLAAAGNWEIAADSIASQIEASGQLTIEAADCTVNLRNMTFLESTSVVVNGGNNGIVDLSGAVFPAANDQSFTLNSGRLVLPAGKEGTMAVPETAFLSLVLNDAQLASSYASQISSGIVTFFKLGEGGSLVELTEGVIGNSYISPTPQWNPVNASSKWVETSFWTGLGGQSVPTSGDIVIDATGLTEDFSIIVPSSFSSIDIIGDDEYTISVAFQNGATPPSTLSVFGRVKLPVSAINDAATFMVSAGAVLIADAASETTLTKALSGDFTFCKDGNGDLTLGAHVVANGGCVVQKGVLKLSGSGWIGPNNAYTTAGNVTVTSGAVLDLNGAANSYLNTVTLGEASVLRNSGADISNGSRQLKGIILDGDAVIDAQNDFGLIAHAYAQTTLTLNDYGLLKTGAGNFWVVNTLGYSGSFRIKEGALYAHHTGSVLTGVNLSIEGNAGLTLNARLSGLASLRFHAGNGGVSFSGIANLDEAIRPALDAAYVDFATLTVGDAVTLMTNTEDGLADRLVLAPGGRFSSVQTTEGGAITATVGALQNFWHYSFDGAGTTEALSKAADSRYAVGGWGDVNGNDLSVLSRNGRAACLHYTSASQRFSPYWNSNTANVSPFHAGVATIATVMKPAQITPVDDESSKKIVWGLGSGIEADCVALVVDDNDDSVSLVTRNGSTLVSVTGVEKLTTKYHFVAAVFTPEGTTLMVDGRSATSDKVVPYTIDGRGQLGSVHGGVPSGTSRMNGDNRCYLDDWTVYDALLTPAELRALRAKYCPQPVVFIIR